MPTTQADIQGWLKEAKREKATHLIVVCDSFDHEDYPVLVKPGQDPKERASEYQNKDMQRDGGVRAPPRLGHSAQGVPLVSLRDALLQRSLRSALQRRKRQAKMAKRSDEELDAIAGVGRSQLLAAFANGEVKVVEVRADARRVRIKSPQVYDLPQPILPTACNHEFDAILGSNKCKHCGCSFVQAWHGGGRAKSV